ncbi:MAG: VWA domain-containing protein [Gammaproteobacteria bacterium]|nr:VWA domain-containing protein [Gammaproteobacteria bacterium]
MRKARRSTEVFSLAFLDVITCGFGAIILLLMISKTGTTPVLETSPTPLDGIVRDLQVQLFEIRGEAKVLDRELNAKHEQISVWEDRVARLQAELALAMKNYANVRDDASANTIIKGEFAIALQKLTEEMKRLQAQQGAVRTDLVGGIPVDSEYIVFVIDTSGSMLQLNWGNMINQMIATLDIYPKVKGLQILSDEGEYLFSETRRKWIPDTPGRRKVMISTLRGWRTFSDSSPVEGIIAAIRTFQDPGKKISIYVLGDDFTGRSIREVIDAVDKINRPDAQGNRPARIHALGFPIPPEAGPEARLMNTRFAMLMREVTRRNGGTFVGLDRDQFRSN